MPVYAEMNPADLLNKSGRYLQKVERQDQGDGFICVSRQTNGEPAAFVPQVEVVMETLRSDYIKAL